MTANPTKVPASLRLFCAFRAIVSRTGVRDDGSRMEPSTHEASANFGGMTDRRGTSRFPVREDVKYSVMLSKTSKASGIGKTLNFGSSGILFTTGEKLPVGRTVELSVNWPARLGGTCPLQFVATGRGVRSDGTCKAVRIVRYEFPTRGATAAAAGSA